MDQETFILFLIIIGCVLGILLLGLVFSVVQAKRKERREARNSQEQRTQAALRQVKNEIRVLGLQQRS